LNIKLKGRHFDTIEVLEAELQAVLNTLTEHDFINVAEALVTVHKLGRVLLRKYWWSAGRKLVFDQMAAPVLDIMDGSLYKTSDVTVSWSCWEFAIKPRGTLVMHESPI
jgi:hypothetical protein